MRGTFKDRQQAEAFEKRIAELEKTLGVVIYNITLAKEELEGIKKEL